MRIAIAIGLLLSLTQSDVERAQRLARESEAARAAFHARYIVDLGDATVPQIEIVTDFRRVVLITEEHLRKGDWLFSQSVQSAEDALAPTRGTVVLIARLRFSPLNAFVTVPAYQLATGPAGGALAPIETNTTPEYSTPFKNPQGKVGSALTGATLEASVPSSFIGQERRLVGVMLEGREIARTTVDFAHLD